jgi:hypothetical protein
MKYLVLKSRQVPNLGVVNAGETRDIEDAAIAKDLVAQGVIEAVRAKAKPTTSKEAN